MTETPLPLANYLVYIATPCMDGKYDREYARALFDTVGAINDHGGKANWLELPGCSDLQYARSRIFGKFLRSDATHLLMVDSDMGWLSGDVIRMLLLNRDFLGAVGLKKNEKTEFAFVNCDDHGNILPIDYEADTGITNVTEIGMAFVLITRACAEKMAAHYNDLIYDDLGQPEHDMFQSFIIPGTTRRLPEDFAFCYRWRKIGGKVQVLPDVRLHHIGKKAWVGALSDVMFEKPGERSEQVNG